MGYLRIDFENLLPMQTIFLIYKRYHMKNILLLFSLFLSLPIFSQTRRMVSPEAGRTYNTQIQSSTELPMLQAADRQFRAFAYENTYFALENAVAQNPNSPEALLSRARFKKVVGMETEAILDYQLAKRLNPYAANLYGYYGSSGLLEILTVEPERSILSLTNFQKLNYYYEVLNEKAPLGGNTSEEEAYQELESLTSVIQDIEENYLLSALSQLESLLETYPESAIVHDLRGVVLTKQNHLAKARAAFLKALELDPQFAIAWYNLGQIERSMGHYEQAKVHLDKAIELQANLTKAYFERALVLKAMGDPQSALSDYDAVIDLKGADYPEAFLNRGLTKKILGDYNGALADLNQAISAYPNNAELWKNRGNLYLLFGLPLKAIDDYTEAIQLDNNYAEAYYNRALAHLQGYDKISGCADLETSLSLGYEKAQEIQTYFCTY